MIFYKIKIINRCHFMLQNLKHFRTVIMSSYKTFPKGVIGVPRYSKVFQVSKVSKVSKMSKVCSSSSFMEQMSLTHSVTYAILILQILSHLEINSGDHSVYNRLVLKM